MAYPIKGEIYPEEPRDTVRNPPRDYKVVKRQRTPLRWMPKHPRERALIKKRHGMQPDDTNQEVPTMSPRGRNFPSSGIVQLTRGQEVDRARREAQQQQALEETSESKSPSTTPEPRQVRLESGRRGTLTPFG